MGKSPAKWIKSVLLGKKSGKSNSAKAKDLLPKTANGNGHTAGKEPELSGNSPVISEPVLVTNGISNLANGSAVGNMVRNGSDTPISPEKLREELAATKAQAAFRGYLARRAFRALKGIIRLQALIRGHLVRRQAVSTLRATWLIVKFQALIRGRNTRLSNAAMQLSVKFGQHNFGGDKSSDAWKEKLASNAYVRKLLSSSTLVQALHFQYDETDPNSAYSWLERWTIGCIWRPVSKPKIVADGKPQVRKASYAMETKSAKLKRNVRKFSAATVETQTNTVEPEKSKRNPRKFSGSPADSVPDSQLSELEKVKRNLKKATNSMVEASKISNSKADASKVPNSITDEPKISDSMADSSKISTVVNGISGHHDNQCEKALHSACEASFPPETHDPHSGNLLENSNMETPFLTEEKSDEPSILAQEDEVMDLQNLNNGDDTIQKKEETRYKEEPLSNGQVRTKRRSSFSNSEYPESGTKNTPVPPRKPSYMAPTESLKAKLRGPPRLDFDLPVDKNGFTRRQSLPSAPNNRGVKTEWRR
ncbi:protein IQ-DOMAIN 31-like [Lolium rigidum]|uniref:protein IQ-DOMAIN 31-like n=1 Tax=Lolium rigidum TaxID=89674 RepID=UPI001F5CD4C5|nr:protein IQ-DOMAIN 31-like [Lolium rigidum]